MARFETWQDAALAAMCENCGATYAQHIDRYPITKNCNLGWSAGHDRQPIDHEINGMLVVSDQYGRPYQLNTGNVKTGWGGIFKQMRLKER